jgi:hypothetical protein
MQVKPFESESIACCGPDAKIWHHRFLPLPLLCACFSRNSTIPCRVGMASDKVGDKDSNLKL